MIIFRKPMISLATILVVSTAMVACVNKPQKEITPINSELESRVTGRWDALMAKRFDEAYEFFTPAYRNLFPLQHYLSKTGSSVNWLSVNIKDIQFDDKLAKVKVEVEYILNLPMGVGDDFGHITKDIDEVWLWVDETWWYTSNDDGSLF